MNKDCIVRDSFYKVKIGDICLTKIKQQWIVVKKDFQKQRFYCKPYKWNPPEDWLEWETWNFGMAIWRVWEMKVIGHDGNYNSIT